MLGAQVELRAAEPAAGQFRVRIGGVEKAIGEKAAARALRPPRPRRSRFRAVCGTRFRDPDPRGAPRKVANQVQHTPPNLVRSAPNLVSAPVCGTRYRDPAALAAHHAKSRTRFSTPRRTWFEPRARTWFETRPEPGFRAVSGTRIRDLDPSPAHHEKSRTRFSTPRRTWFETRSEPGSKRATLAFRFPRRRASRRPCRCAPT